MNEQTKKQLKELLDQPHMKRQITTLLVLLEEEIREKAGDAAFDTLWHSKNYEALRDLLNQT